MVYLCIKMTVGVGLCMDHITVLVDVLVVSVKQYSWPTERTAQVAGICEQLQTSPSPENWDLMFSKPLHIKLFILFKSLFQSLKFNWVIFIFWVIPSDWSTQLHKLMVIGTLLIWLL